MLGTVPPKFRLLLLAGAAAGSAAGVLLPYGAVSDLDGYCEDCYNRIVRESGVHTYSYKPEPIFFGDGPRFLGVELEIDGGGESNQNAVKIQNVGNALSEHIYIKHDGSLDDGLEIVTHPMTLDYHCHGMQSFRRPFPWVIPATKPGPAACMSM